MNSFFSIPDDVFKQIFISYLSISELVLLDYTIIVNNKCYLYFLEKVNGLIISDIYQDISYLTLKWLLRRNIYLRNMKFDKNIIDFELISSIKTLKHIKHLSLIDCEFITDDTIISIATSLNNLTKLDLYQTSWLCISNITDLSIITISQHCKYLISLNITNNQNITDESIIAVANNCNNLHELIISNLMNITDASIITISLHCNKLNYLNINNCFKITTISIISVATNCKKLLNISCSNCDYIFDYAIEMIAMNCIDINSININKCLSITDQSLIIISKLCKYINNINIGNSNITDIGIQAIAINCKQLKYLDISNCWNITSLSIITIANHCIELQQIHLTYDNNNIEVLESIQYLTIKNPLLTITKHDY